MDVCEDGGQGGALLEQALGLFHRLPALAQARPREDARQLGRLPPELRQSGLGLAPLVSTGHQPLHESLQLSDRGTAGDRKH